MEQAKTLNQGQSHKPHPIFFAAAGAVLLFSLLGVAALTGILPTATPKQGDQVAQQTQPQAAQPGTQSGAQPVAQPGAQPRTGAQPKAVAPAPANSQQAAAPCVSCGVIETIRAVEVKGKTSGIGAVAGGVAGGVLGNAIGGGHGAGNAVLTIGGAAGGAFAGDAVEGHMKKHTVWRVTVRLDDGSVRTVQQAAQPPFAVGDRVRVVDGKAIERA